MIQINNLLKKILLILSWIGVVFFLLSAITFKTILAKIAFLVIALLLVPQISKLLGKYIPLFKNNFIKAAVVFVLLITAALLENDKYEVRKQKQEVVTTEKTEKIEEQVEKTKKKEEPKPKFTVAEQKEILVKYIKQISEDKSLQNIKKLSKAGEYFQNTNHALQNPDDGYIKSISTVPSDTTLFVFNPKIDFKKAKAYLKSTKKGRITNYYILYTLIQDNLAYKQTIVTFGKENVDTVSNDIVFDIADYIDEKQISLIIKKNEKEKCSETISQMERELEFINESLLILDNHYKNHSQRDFENSIGSLNRSMREMVEESEQKINWSCCPNAEKSLGAALRGLLLVGNAYSRAYRRGLQDVRLYKKQLKQHVRQAKRDIRNCK